MQKSRSAMSTKTGRAPVYRTLLALAMKVNGTVITSSPGPMPYAEQREVQRRRSGAGGDRVAGTDERRELLLELADARALRQRSGGHRLPDPLLLLLAHLRASDRDHDAVASCGVARLPGTLLLSLERRHDAARRCDRRRRAAAAVGHDS